MTLVETRNCVLGDSPKPPANKHNSVTCVCGTAVALPAPIHLATGTPATIRPNVQPRTLYAWSLPLLLPSLRSAVAQIHIIEPSDVIHEPQTVKSKWDEEGACGMMRMGKLF